MLDIKLEHYVTRREEIIGRILSNVRIDPVTDCWEWLGGDSGKGRGGGYGRVSLNGTTCAVHIVVYTHFFGYIPGKKQIDHKCNNRICCNPNHLELVSAVMNQRRKIRKG